MENHSLKIKNALKTLRETSHGSFESPNVNISAISIVKTFGKNLSICCADTVGEWQVTSWNLTFPLNYSPSSRLTTLGHPFIFGTSFLTRAHRQQCN